MSKPKKRGSRGIAKLVPGEHPKDCLCIICGDNDEGWSDDFLNALGALAGTSVAVAAFLFYMNGAVARANLRGEIQADYFKLPIALNPPAIDIRNEPHLNRLKNCAPPYRRSDGAVCSKCVDSIGPLTECDGNLYIHKAP